jgi:hypothetical protein
MQNEEFLSVKSVKSAVNFFGCGPTVLNAMKNVGTGGHGGRRGKNSVLSAFSCSSVLRFLRQSASICGQFRIQPPLAALGVSPLPLWVQYDTQVTNAQALATIRIFSRFSIDISTYQLYNYPRMVRNVARNEWTNGDRTKEAKAEN